VKRAGGVGCEDLLGRVNALKSLQTLATDEPDQDHHDRNDQEHVDETANGVRGDKTKDPKDKQYDSNGFENLIPPKRPQQVHLDQRPTPPYEVFNCGVQIIPIDYTPRGGK
jgi:hypothetical protein